MGTLQHSEFSASFLLQIYFRLHLGQSPTHMYHLSTFLPWFSLNCVLRGSIWMLHHNFRNWSGHRNYFPQNPGMLERD
jgi:heme/copper-type cytochrome/quinol oxidase subunit 4